MKIISVNNKTVRIAVLLLTCTVSSVSLSDEIDLCKDVLSNGVFNVDNKAESLQNNASFRDWQCSATFKNHQEAINSGLNVGFVLYEVPIEVGGTWDQNKVSAWKSKHCSTSSMSRNINTATYRLIKSAAPSILSAWSTCMQKQVSQKTNKPLQCKFKKNGNKYVFTASWKRSKGEDNTSAVPIVSEWNVSGGSCIPSINVGSKVLEAARQTTCTQKKNDDLVILLETHRGSCYKSSASLIAPYVISDRVVLDNPLNIKEDVVHFSPNAVIVTNGYNLTIDASRELKISGAPKIVSFENRENRPTGEHGRDAGAITIQGGIISGTSLQIENHGEHGTNGKNGTTGATGVRGKKGVGSINKWGSCKGRRNGGRGGTGGAGTAGQDGGNAGFGGPVNISFRDGLVNGAIHRINVIKKQINPVDGSTYTCEGTCNGKHGLGGSGGAGGAGGPGGQGGSKRSADCDPSSGGPGGATGPKGPDGKAGRGAKPGIIVTM